MNNLVKNIYNLVLPYYNCAKELWYNQLMNRLQKQIDLNHMDASDGIVWTEWDVRTMKGYLDTYKLRKEIKEQMPPITDEILAAAKALEPIFETESSLRYWNSPHLVPFRDRIHTKGVFRRANITDDKNEDG